MARRHGVHLEVHIPTTDSPAQSKQTTSRLLGTFLSIELQPNEARIIYRMLYVKVNLPANMQEAFRSSEG